MCIHIKLVFFSAFAYDGLDFIDWLWKDCFCIPSYFEICMVQPFLVTICRTKCIQHCTF